MQAHNRLDRLTNDAAVDVPFAAMHPLVVLEWVFLNRGSRHLQLCFLIQNGRPLQVHLPSYISI